MKTLISTIVFLTCLQLSAQKINYSFPDGYENEISKKQYKYLVNESVKQLSKNYQIASVKKGVIKLEEGQDYSLVNLHNLILECSQIDKKQWGTYISSHFESMYEAISIQKQLDPTKFETLVEYFSIRIYEENYVMQAGGKEQLVVKKQLEGTLSLLMLDLPSAFTPVKREMFELWNKTEDEVFEIAQKNVNKQEFVKVTEPIEFNDQTIEVSFIENEDYGASIALDLDTNAPEFVGEWGSVLAIPNKGIVDIIKVTKDKPLDYVLFIQALKPVVEQYYDQHPQRISTDFFWYYQGTFTKIQVSDTNGHINIISPMGLSKLMTEGK